MLIGKCDKETAGLPGSVYGWPSRGHETGWQRFSTKLSMSQCGGTRYEKQWYPILKLGIKVSRCGAGKSHLEGGGKIVLPPSALERLASLHIDYPVSKISLNPTIVIENLHASGF